MPFAACKQKSTCVEVYGAVKTVCTLVYAAMEKVIYTLLIYSSFRFIFHYPNINRNMIPYIAHYSSFHSIMCRTSQMRKGLALLIRLLERR